MIYSRPNIKGRDMSDRQWFEGDYCQLSPGDAPPEDWAIVIQRGQDEEEIMIAVTGEKQFAKIKANQLYPVESETYKAVIRESFKRAMRNQRSLADIWNDPNIP